jgi:methyl-accepting chemotaxis protein
LAREHGIREVVSEFRDVARRVAQGDLAVRVAETSGSELGALAGT